MDSGEGGLDDTLAFLNEHGIAYFGAGSLEARCNNPALLDVDGLCVALLGYACRSTHPTWAGLTSSGVLPIEMDRIAHDVAESRGLGAQSIVVCLHWGDEQMWLPKPTDLVIAEKLLRLGVDLIIGHHAHCRQPVFSSECKSVFFGLGNAIFPDLAPDTLGGAGARWRQRWWNRESTLVQFNPRTGARWSGLRYQNGQVVRSSPRLGRQRTWQSLPSRDNAQGYAARYRRVRRFSAVRSAISRFMAQPRWPSWQTLRDVARNVAFPH
jgi:hypothetical protein